MHIGAWSGASFAKDHLGNLAHLGKFGMPESCEMLRFFHSTAHTDGVSLFEKLPDPLDKEVLLASELACLEEMLDHGMLLNYHLAPTQTGRVIYRGPAFDQLERIFELPISSSLKAQAASVLASTMIRYRLDNMESYFDYLAERLESKGVNCQSSVIQCDSILKFASAVMTESAKTSLRIFSQQRNFVEKQWRKNEFTEIYLAKLRVMELIATFYLFSYVRADGQTPRWIGQDPKESFQRKLIDMAEDIEALAQEKLDNPKLNSLFSSPSISTAFVDLSPEQEQLAIRFNTNLQDQERFQEAGPAPLTAQDLADLKEISRALVVDLKNQSYALRAYAKYIDRLVEGDHLENANIAPWLVSVKTETDYRTLTLLFILFQDTEIKLPGRYLWINTMKELADERPELAHLRPRADYCNEVVQAHDKIVIDVLTQFELEDFFHMDLDFAQKDLFFHSWHFQLIGFSRETFSFQKMVLGTGADRDAIEKQNYQKMLLAQRAFMIQCMAVSFGKYHYSFQNYSPQMSNFRTGFEGEAMLNIQNFGPISDKICRDPNQNAEKYRSYFFDVYLQKRSQDYWLMEVVVPVVITLISAEVGGFLARSAVSAASKVAARWLTQSIAAAIARGAAANISEHALNILFFFPLTAKLSYSFFYGVPFWHTGEHGFWADLMTNWGEPALSGAVIILCAMPFGRFVGGTLIAREMNIGGKVVVQGLVGKYLQTNWVRTMTVRFTEFSADTITFMSFELVYGKLMGHRRTWWFEKCKYPWQLSYFPTSYEKLTKAQEEVFCKELSHSLTENSALSAAFLARGMFHIDRTSFALASQGTVPMITIPPPARPF